jgi:glycosyltransferase involved in cell wall biosynthesis
MAHNVESLIWQRYTETETNPIKRWFLRQQWKKFEAFERWAYTTATRTVAVSPDDAQLMREHFGATRVEVVDNGVDTVYFRPTDLAREPKTILFLGSLDWRPNLDGVRILLDSIFPAVAAKEPDAKLLLVGRNPPAWLRDRTNGNPSVELHGNVPDVRPFIARAGMLAVPLRIGGGSRLKILEALASGLPVVSTRLGAEGLELTGGKHLDVVEECAGMSEAMLSAMRDPERMRTMTDAGRNVVLAHYDWDSLADRLQAVWLDAAGHAPATRAA